MTPDEYSYWKHLPQTNDYFKALNEEINKLEQVLLDSGHQFDISRINFLIGYRAGIKGCLDYEPQKEEITQED